MSKVYAMRNAGTNNGSSRQNNNGGTKKKDRFQEAYEQGTRIYEQNRSQLVQQTQQLQTQLQGIGNGPLTYQQARDVRTYYNNLQSLTTYGFDTSEQIQAIGGFARQNNQLLSTYKTEKDYNNGYLYPARYSGLSGSTNTTNQLDGLRRTIGALRQRGGDKARADALQAEYDWLEQHQYDYWSQDELDDRIKHVEGLLADANQAVYDSGNYTQTSTGQTRRQNSGYMYDNPLGTEADHKEADAKEHAARYTAQINALKAAKEANAYRDAMAGWGEQDFKNMGELATEVTKRDEADKASTWSAMAAAFGGSPDGGLSAHAQAESHQPRITELYSYFRDKGLSNEQIDSLVSYFQRNQNMMQRQKDMQELSAFAKEHPVLASAISVPINLMSGVGYVDLALQNATAGTDAITGEKQRVDQYSALTLMGDASSAMRGAVSEDMGGFGSFLYNTGMSMADFLAAAPAGGGATELMLGGAAAMQATREAYARGASDGQALGMGAWAGASEAAFEHLSLGSLKAMRTSVTAARGTFKQILVDMAKQGFVEGSEETFTTISNTLGDAFIMGDKSALNSAIRDYMENDGLSEEEATRKAYTEWAKNTALDFAGGALSGGVLGGGNRVRMNWAQGVQGQAILDRGQELEVINTALAMPEGSEARVFAEHLAETKMKSGDYTATEIGQLAWAVEAQRAQTKSEDNPASDMPRTHPVVTTAADGSGATVMATQMSEVAEALVAAGDTHQEALAKTKVIEAVVAGDAALTGSQINKVGFDALTAQSTVDVIKQYTGVDITANGKTASAVRKSILAARDQQAERAAQIKAEGEAIHAARAAVDAAAAQNDADAAAKATAMLDEAQAAASTGARAQVPDTAAGEVSASAGSAAAPVGDTKAAATAASETAAPAGDDTLHFSNGGSLTFKEFVEAYHDMNPDNPASKRELAQRFGELLDAQTANGGTLSAKEMNRAISGEAAAATTDTRGKSTGKSKPTSKAKPTGKAKFAGKAESDLSGKARAELEASRNDRDATKKGKTVKVAEGVEFAAREDGLQKLSDTQVWTGALVYRFMKNIGIKKVVYDAAYVGSDANALIEDGVIYINPEAKGMDNRGTILWTLGHEISHPATNGSKKDNALAEKILSTFEKVAKLGALKEGKLQSQVTARTTTVNKALARYKAFYEAHGNAEMAARVDEHFASQEVAGDWLGWAFQSREIMERIGRVDPSTLTRMQRAVVRLQQTVTNMRRAQARKQYGTGIGIIDADADSAAEAEKIIRGLADDVNAALKKSELYKSFKAKDKRGLTDRGTIKENNRKENKSDEREERRSDRRGRKDSGRAGTGRRAWAATREAVQGQRSNDGSADLGVHGRELSSQIREIATRSGAPDLGLHESSHADFSAALDAGKAANRNGAMVDSQSVDSLAENGTTTFLAENGMAGVAIEADGNIVGVFKNPALRTNNATYDLLLTALANGGDHLDCYVLQPDVSPKNLGQLYSDLGFVPVAFLRFNREYASPDWDYERFGEPDVVMWIHNGDSVETVADKMGTYPDIYTPEYIRENCREFTDYDAAKAYQKEQLKNRNAARDSEEAGAVSASTPEIKGRFSVTEPIEYTKNLVALHNFSSMSMRRILRDGGMPTASIAVVKHDMAHTAFGDWTIVLPRESVDPQANPNNKMWGGDAYTPMVNHLEMPHAVDEDATDAIIDELVDKTGDPYYNRILSEVVLTMRRGGVDKAISDYVQNLGLDPDLRDVFNADQSEDVKAARSDPELLGATDEALRYYWPGNPVSEDMLADAAEAVDDALGTDFLDQIENGDDTAFVDFCNRVNETPAAVANWMHERFDGAVSEAPAHVMNVDRYTGEVLEEQPYTLENVVRMMYDYFPHQSFDTDPSDLQDPDLNGWQSAAVPKINSIDEAHELSDRLRKDRVEHRDKLTKLRDQLISVTKNILPFARHMSFQNVAELLSSTASAKSTSEIKNAFFKEGAILPETLAEKVLEVNQAFADLPQQYFEAKAERVIDLDEMKKGLIVAPKDAPKDLLDQVRQVFPNVVTYDTQRPETRLDAVNSPVGQNLRFSISDADYMDAVKDGDMETAQRMVDEAAKRAGYDIKAYHGTRSGNFNVFDPSRSGENYGGYNAEGGGISFTRSEDWARRWGAKARGDGDIRVVPAYLKTQKTFYSYNGEVDPELRSELPDDLSESEKDVAMANGATFHKTLEDNGVNFKEAILRHGYDSYSMYPGADNIAVYDPAQVKSADPVTYDDNGNVIPLSERFNSNNDDVRYSINPEFASDIDEWDQDGRKAHVIFDLGTTGEVLQSLGATEGDIRLDSEKIETILKEHPEMTLDDIKALGEIVNNPVLVLKSRNVNRSAPNTRVVMIGDHKASNGKYVLAILDLSPNNSNLRVAGMQKLSSSYTKLDTPSTPDAFRQLLKMSYVMYYDPKRAAKVLSAAGLRLRSTPDSASDKKAARELPLTGLQSRPGHYSQSGFVGSVAYQRDFVKPSEYIVKMYGAKPSDVFEDIPARRYSVTRDQFDNDEDFRAFYRDLFGGLGLTERAHAETQADNTPPDREVSLVRSNTFDHLFTSAEKRMDELKEGEFEYDRVTEVQSMSEARERLDADYEGERDYLESHSFTNGTDLDTAMGILSVELANARETGDYTDAVDWAHVIRANGTAAGQLVQAFAKYSRTPEGVLVNAIETLEESDLDPDRQDEIIERIFEFSRTLHDIERGNEEGRGDLIDLILEQAEMRNTKVSKTTLKNLSSGQITWLYDLALAQMDQIARDFIKPSFAKGLSTFQTISHLFNIRTTNRNLGSNTLFSPIAAIGNNLAIIPDAIASVFTGQRYVGFDRWIFSKATWKGMREGGAKAWVEVALDVQPEPTQRDKYGTARRTWKMTGGRAARVGSTIEKMMGYELNFTDEFHKGGVRAEIMQSLEPMVRNGVITTEMAEQWAEQEALYRAFQDDTYMGNLLAILKNGMNTIGIGHTGRKIGNLEIKEFGVGDLVQKYTQVPGALFTRAVEFSPVGYAKCLYLMAQMSSAAKESKKANAKYETLQARADASLGKDALVSRAFRAKTAAETAQVQAATAQRMFALAVGRATTGTGLLALFATLALKGVLRRADDEDDPNVKAQNLSEGITGTQLNTSALARMIRGDSAEYQTGDHLVSVDWIEPINGLMTMGALIAKDTDGDQSFADKAKSYGLNSLDGLYLAFSDLPTMQTLQTIRDTVNYYDEEDSPTGSLPLDIAIEVGRGSLTGFIPSPVRQIAQATDPVQRDAYTSNSVMQQTWDQIRNSIPGLRQQLPVKKDNLGNDRKQEGGLLGILNATFLPGNIRTYRQSEYSKEMYEVYEATGDSSFYPGKSAPYSISMSIDGEQTQYKLDADQRVQYQRTRGATMYALIKDMHDDPVWKAATPEERAEMLSMAKNLATYAANQEVAKANGKTYTNNEYEKTNGALDVGYTVASWQNIRSAMSGVEGVDEDGDGKADSGTKKAEALRILADLDLTDEQKVYWYRGSSYAEETDKVGEAMAAGISANDWFSAKIALSNAHGTDNNGDGKTDSGSVQADVIRILMSMNLTPEQRRLLFLQMYPQSTKKANGTNWGD